MRNAAHTLAHPALEREERETPLPALRGVQRGPTHPQSAHRCRCSRKRQHRAGVRLQRWSFFCNDGMVMFFFQGTIAIDGFSMVLPALDHHHWMFFYRSTIDINGFPMVFPNSGAMVSDGFDLERDLKMRIIVSASIFNSSDQQVLSWYF